MPYLLSVDLGTTFSAAAISEGGRVEIIPLGSQTATIPSVVALRADGTVLTGEAAERRSVTEPTRVAREFKRRLGDPTPMVIGGTPYGAETLMAHLLKGIVDRVAQQQASPPTKVILSHPANYGPYKLDLLEQVGHLAESTDVEFITEPQAAAVHYSGLERIEAGEVVAVYDLGGGTFDAALVRRTETGFELLGTPDGMERFGGIDLDEAVFEHVRRSLGRALEGLDPTDAAVTSALARLRKDCRSAKEGLSADTDAAIPVMLPSLHTEVRLTRSEFEDMIRPRLRETMTTLERVARSAGLEFSDLSRVLLVGGSSRIPLVGEMVREATGRPVGLGAHPKHAIALGAAEAGAAGATRPTVAVETAQEPEFEETVDPQPAELHLSVPEEPEPPIGGPETEPKSDEPDPALDDQGPEVEKVVASDDVDSLDRTETPPAEKSVGRRIPWIGIIGALVALAAIIAGIVLLGGDNPAPPDQTTQQTRPDQTTQPTEPGEGTEPEPGDAFPPVEGPAPASNVLALYFTNFMTPDARGEWGAWSGGDEYTPPGDIASDFYPALDVYDSTDPVLIARHFAWMRSVGIGTVVVVWDGPDSPSATAMPLLLEMALRYELSFALALPGIEGDPQMAIDLAGAARQTYGEDPAWLRVDGRGGADPQPVLFLGVPDGYEVDPELWSAPLDELRAMGLTVVIDSRDLAWIVAGADGLVAGANDRDYSFAFDLPDDALYVPTVSPGRSASRIGEPEISEDRRGGERYREDWELAHELRPPNLVVISTFNSWIDGTQIEPARPDPPDRPDSPYQSYEPLAPEDYLHMTGELVDRFGYR